MKKFNLINKLRSRIKVFEPFKNISKPGIYVNSMMISYGYIYKRISKPVMNDSSFGKRQLFLEHLSHTKIKKIHGVGLMIAVELENEKICTKFVKKALKKGVITFYFLFNKNCIRISPPLTISLSDIIESCSIIKNVLDDC